MGQIGRKDILHEGSNKHKITFAKKVKLHESNKMYKTIYIIIINLPTKGKREWLQWNKKKIMKNLQSIKIKK